MAQEILQEQDRRWADTQSANAPDLFRRYVSGRKPCFFRIGCFDSQVSGDQIFACGPGEVLIDRNVATMVKDPTRSVRPDARFATP